MGHSQLSDHEVRILYALVSREHSRLCRRSTAAAFKNDGVTNPGLTTAIANYESILRTLNAMTKPLPGLIAESSQEAPMR